MTVCVAFRGIHQTPSELHQNMLLKHHPIEIVVKAADLTQLRDTLYNLVVALSAGASANTLKYENILDAEVDPRALHDVLQAWAATLGGDVRLIRRSGEVGRPSYLSVDEMYALAEAERARREEEGLREVLAID
jgi:hypothetical protein